MSERRIGEEQLEALLRDALLEPLPADTARRHEELLRAAAAGAVPMVPRASRTWRRVAVVALAATMAIGASAVGALAADKAVPGDTLYGLDRAIERLELAMARSPEAKASRHLELAGERLDELKILERRGHDDRVPKLADEVGSSDDAALAAAQAVDGDHAGDVRSRVEERVAKHAADLIGVRNRLEASGRASQAALDALQRVIEKTGRRGSSTDDRSADNGSTDDERRGPKDDEHANQNRGRSGEAGEPSATPSPRGADEGHGGNDQRTGDAGSSGSGSGPSGSRPGEDAGSRSSGHDNGGDRGSGRDHADSGGES